MMNRQRMARWSGVLMLGLGLALPVAAQEPQQRINEEALEALQQEARQGDPDAQFRMGWLYSHGIAVEQDDERAMLWYRRAATQNHVDAMYNIAVKHEMGTGVEPDAEEAFLWYKRAAENGDLDAQWNVAVMYSEGIGTEDNAVEAMHWYREAAGQGHAKAQFNLAVIHLQRADPPTAADLIQAYTWFALASAGGIEEADTNRSVIADHLSEEDRVVAVERATQWLEAQAREERP